jgi:hypothetical protein
LAFGIDPTKIHGMVNQTGIYKKHIKNSKYQVIN